MDGEVDIVCAAQGDVGGWKIEWVSKCRSRARRRCFDTAHPDVLVEIHVERGLDTPSPRFAVLWTYRSTRLIETREPRPFPALAASLPRSTSNAANMRQEVTLTCEFSNETNL